MARDYSTLIVLAIISLFVIGPLMAWFVSPGWIALVIIPIIFGLA